MHFGSGIAAGKAKKDFGSSASRPIPCVPWLTYKRANMQNAVRILSFVALASAALAAACKPGYETGTVYKVLDQNVSSKWSGGPKQAAEEGSRAEGLKPLTLRTILFSSGGKRYSLLLPGSPDQEGLDLSPGHSICFREENDGVHVATTQGKTLPGTAKILPRIPHK
jgi:hypothetical protein